MKRKKLACILSLLLISTSISCSAVFADDSGLTTEFEQDFENPDYQAEIQWETVQDGSLYRNHICNGETAKNAIAANNMTILEGTYDLSNVTGTLVSAGLEGYTGITAYTGFMAAIYKGTTAPNKTERGKVSTLFVVPDDDGNHALSMELLNTQGYNHALFGKDRLDLYGSKKKFSFAFKNLYNTSGLTTLTITKGTGTWAEKYNEKAVAQGLKFDHSKNLGLNSTVEATDAVVIHNGKAYIGNGIDSNYMIDQSKYICDVSEAGVYYTVDVYLDYTEDAPKIVVIIKDADENMLGYKKAMLPVAKTGVTTVNAVGKTGPNSLNPFLTHNGVNTAVPFTSSASSNGYGAYIFGNSAGGPASLCIDNFSMRPYEDSELPSFELVTALDKYSVNPVSFLGAQTIELEFNLALPEEIGDTVTVTDVRGNAVDFSVSSSDKKLTLRFPQGFSATSNYYITLAPSFVSASDVALEKEVVIHVRTRDNLNINACTLSGTTLSADITNESSENWKIVVVAAVKTGDLLENNRLYYKAALLESAENEVITISDLDIPSGSEVNVFVIDGFEGLKAFSDVQLAQ